MSGVKKFRGVSIPAEIFELFEKKEIGATEVVLLALIDALVKPGKGCYASNAYLAERIGKSEVRTRVIIGRLRAAGLVKDVGFNGRRRYLETAWRSIVLVENDAETIRQGDRKRSGRVIENDQAYKRLRKETNTSAPKPEADGVKNNGFGIAKAKPKKTTKFDTDIATQLKEAAQAHLGTSHPRITRGRPSVWAHQIMLLRTLDEIPPERIQKVLDWYARHMGAEFVPVAYHAEAFRKKFLAIEGAMGRDAVSTVTVSPEAERVAGRLAMLGWPKGSAEMVPQAVQVCLEGYGGWVSQFKATVARLEADKGKARLLRLAQHVERTLPAPSQFVQGWMTDVHGRVSGWESWSGDFKPYLFKPESKKFRNTGRGWAEAYNSDPDSWDRLITEVKTEGTL